MSQSSSECPKDIDSSSRKVVQPQWRGLIPKDMTPSRIRHLAIANNGIGEISESIKVVGAGGFEPPTSSSLTELRPVLRISHT